MRTLYLHLGLHKTGTSYLQALLSRNRENLSAAGLAVPKATHKDSHERHALALQKGGARAFLDAIDWSLGDRQIISSERLGSLMCSPRRQLAEELATLARRKNIALHLILLLRRQDILKESIFSEVVKTWYQGSIEEENHYEYDFDRRLRYLERFFDIENISIAIHHKNGPQPLSEVFMGLLGLDSACLALVDVERKNTRMNRRETMFLSKVPKKSPRFVKAVRFSVERHDFIRDDGQVNLMSPAQHAEFLARYQQGNEALMSRYGLSDTRWSYPTFDSTAAWSPPSPIEPEEYIAVMMGAVKESWLEAERRVLAAN